MDRTISFDSGNCEEHFVPWTLLALMLIWQWNVLVTPQITKGPTRGRTCKQWYSMLVDGKEVHNSIVQQEELQWITTTESGKCA